MQQGWTEDLYFKKRISYTLRRRQFLFDTAELLFSTHEIDLGTQLLLRRLLEQAEPPDSLLDLGCGYGVIGIVLAALWPQARALLVDKDLLAVRYARHNAALNQLDNVEVLPSIGVDQLPPEQFALLVSNVPGHIGDRAIERDFLLEPLKRLRPGGAYWIVVVLPLEPLILDLAQRHQLAVQEVARRPGHVVYAFRL